MEIIATDVDDALYQVCKILDNSPECFPRGMKVKELIQPTIIIQDITDGIVQNKARKLSKEYIKAELDWYLSGEKTIDKIKDYSSMWEKLVGDNLGTVNSNYGEIVFFQKLENYKGTQFDWVIESLTKDKDSRQAIINFNQTKHKYNGVKDFVCCINIQYLIRDNRLIGITNMRSNDLIYGFCNDFPFFVYLQHRIYQELKKVYPELTLGENIHTVASLHVYEKHYQMIKDIIKEYENEIN